MCGSFQSQYSSFRFTFDVKVQSVIFKRLSKCLVLSVSQVNRLIIKKILFNLPPNNLHVVVPLRVTTPQATLIWLAGLILEINTVKYNQNHNAAS